MDFKLENIEKYFPGSPYTPSKQALKIATDMKKGALIYKEMVRGAHYVFPIFLQVVGSKVHDLYAPLPSYFSHDVFHQSLIRKFGKQTSYLHENEAAFYHWDLKDKAQSIAYEGACTITCFPVYLGMYPSISDPKALKKEVVPLFVQLLLIEGGQPSELKEIPVF